MPIFSIVAVMIFVCTSCIPSIGPAPFQETNPFTRPAEHPGAGPQATQLTRPILIRKKNGHYQVAKSWQLRVGGKRWKIQKGYTSNGITAPSRIKASLGDGVNRPETWAAVFHDWLFTQPGISRAHADQLFYETLIAYGVPEHKARLMHTFVAAYSASKKL
jgi:hypothetical protein